jgi:hypothetical protein
VTPPRSGVPHAVKTIKGYPTSSPPPTVKWSPARRTLVLSSCAPDGAAGHEELWQLQAELY